MEDLKMNYMTWLENLINVSSFESYPNNMFNFMTNLYHNMQIKKYGRVLTFQEMSKTLGTPIKKES